MNVTRRNDRVARNPAHEGSMSPHSKDFIQKLCYKKQASVDMTQYGFITDSKLHHVNLLLKPLRDKIQKIFGPVSSRPRQPLPRRRNKTFKVKMDVTHEREGKIRLKDLKD